MILTIYKDDNYELIDRISEVEKSAAANYDNNVILNHLKSIKYIGL